MTDSKGVVMTPYGRYLKVSQRLPDFLEKYPPEEGYGIEIEVRDPLSFRPALLELYKECIRNNRTPRSLPDTNDPSWKALIFIAKLTKDGKVLHTASTHQQIEFEKDYEQSETRARQRLLAALGFGGEILDSDEFPAAEEVGRRISPILDDGDIDTPDWDQSSEQDSDSAAPRSLEVPRPVSSTSDIPTHLQQQVKTLSATLDANGVEYVEPTTKQDALVFIREHRGGNGAAA